MAPRRVLQLLVFACLASALRARGEPYNHLVITPQSPVLEIGTYFTATCEIINTAEITANDLYWNLSDITVSNKQYTKINRSSLSVTIPVIGEKHEWLFCYCKEVSNYVYLNRSKFRHGIILTKGYRPGKPENLSCEAVQVKMEISSTITCVWKKVGRSSTDVPTNYTLYVKELGRNHSIETNGDSAQVNLEVFPHHMPLEIWVEAHNTLGRIESEHLYKDADSFVKTKPPSNIKVISEKSFPTSLLINWTHPIVEEYLKLTYQIRFCQSGSQSWTYVPLVDTDKYIQSFRLQNLRPDTVYIIQVCCKNAGQGLGYWSNWSTNATMRTPEDKPTSKPDLWRKITKVDSVQIICKDPVFANGRIQGFYIKIINKKDKVKNRSEEWERIPVNRSEADGSSSQREITHLKQIHLADEESVKVYVIAVNSVGKSPEASLLIPDKAYGVRDLPPVEGLNVSSQGGQLWLEWKTPKNKAVSEYVVEWAANGSIDWQREKRTTTNTVIKGKLEKFVCYNVSVYPIYSGWTGKPASVEAFLEEGAPLEGPGIGSQKVGRNEVELVWKEIPQDKRQGFIRSYTIFYTSGTKLKSVTVPANTTSCMLRSLSGDTRYDAWIIASTIRGSARSVNHSFWTLKYAAGEIEGIVVGVSLGFLFIVLMIMLLCIYKKDVIKENFWPQIPNPGESTIGTWSPHNPLKAETPKESCLSGISVLDVDVCDGKCVFEEDKASLPLKKDKYLSEEHSSGIGGSSCMSSPRQSVSDSDEGGDMADTTASTIQYSSVMASNGYKGQTPSSQPQQAIFSRSESTQPLLDSEENPDMLLQEGSKHSQRFPRQPCFTHTAQNRDSTDPADCHQQELEQQELLEPLDFYPLEEDSEQTTPTEGQSADWLPAAPASSYMPQLGGYRPHFWLYRPLVEEFDPCRNVTTYYPGIVF